MGSVRLPSTRAPTTGKDIATERERRKAGAPWQGHLVEEAQARRFTEAYHAGVDVIPASDVLPAYDAIVGGADRTLWVREAPSASDQEANWLLLDADGLPLGRLSLSLADEVLAGSSSILVTKHKDEFDVEYLRVFQIRRSDKDDRQGSD